MTKQLIGLFSDESDEEVFEAIVAAHRKVQKHYGPGPHKNGTGQEVHGSGTGLPPTVAAFERGFPGWDKQRWVREHISDVWYEMRELYDRDPKAALSQGYGLKLWEREDGDEEISLSAKQLDELYRWVQWGITKHGGPGPHKSGTPQSVHGKGGPGSPPGASADVPLDLEPEIQVRVDAAPEAVPIAHRLYGRSLTTERELSALLKRIAADTSATFDGWEHRVKPPESIVSKLFRTMDDDGIATLEEAADQIRDLNRYTLMWDPNVWVDSYAQTMDRLRTEGWAIHDSKEKNFWIPGDDYDGFNVQLVKNGVFVEVQFHTPASVAIKHQSHRLFKVARDLPIGSPRRAELVDQIRSLWNDNDGSHRPPGTDGIGFAAYQWIQKSIVSKAVSGFRFYIKSIGDTITPTALYRVEGTEVHRWSGGQWVQSFLTRPELQGLGGSTDYYEISDRQAKEYMGGGSPFAKAHTPISTFSTTVNVAKANKRKNLVFGWANVSTKDGKVILDRQGHMIDPEDLEDAAYEFVVKGRLSGDMHTSEPFGELVESVVVTQDKIDAGVFSQDKLGHWWVGFRVPDDRWESVARGERRMFSIEGSARLEPL